jgi:hypothetical protein
MNSELDGIWILDLHPRTPDWRLCLPAREKLFSEFRPQLLKSQCRPVWSPVKLIISTSGWDERRVPTPTRSPLTRLTTPFGSPASSINSASSIDESGAISEGLRTMVRPASSAGTTLILDVVCPATASINFCWIIPVPILEYIGAPCSGRIGIRACASTMRAERPHPPGGGHESFCLCINVVVFNN